MKLTKDYLLGLQKTAHKALPNRVEEMVNLHSDARLDGPHCHYYRYLYQLLADLKPDFVLELGTSVGISACCMAEGSPSSEVWTVDVHEHPTAGKRFTEFPNIEYLIQDSLTVTLEGRKIDLLFVDTVHDGIQPKQEWEKFQPHMNPGGIALFDDVHINGTMDSFWDKLNPKNWTKLELDSHGRCGFGALINDCN